MSKPIEANCHVGARRRQKLRSRRDDMRFCLRDVTAPREAFVSVLGIAFTVALYLSILGTVCATTLVRHTIGTSREGNRQARSLSSRFKVMLLEN